MFCIVFFGKNVLITFYHWGSIFIKVDGTENFHVLSRMAIRTAATLTVVQKTWDLAAWGVPVQWGLASPWALCLPTRRRLCLQTSSANRPAVWR